MDQSSPYYHTQNMQKRLRDEINHLRSDIQKVDEPQTQIATQTLARTF